MDDMSLFFQKIKAKNIAAISKAITLNESTLLSDNSIIDTLLKTNPSSENSSIIISISGAPGVGKSTFIETFGIYLHSLGKSIAVFSIDPSSELSHGSILGDKTRMNKLSALPNVFIRPSPSSNKLGGLGINTHKNIEIAKIAGFDFIIIESVGVGQSEILASQLCDIFILLLMPSSGDELQGIKKGIMEIADMYIIHKADGSLKNEAEKSKSEVEVALHIGSNSTNKPPPILTHSSLDISGSEAIYQLLSSLINREAWIEKRKKQKLFWFEHDFKEKASQWVLSQVAAEYNTLRQKIEKGDYISLQEIQEMLEKKFNG